MAENNQPQAKDTWTKEDHDRLRAMETAFDPDLWEENLSKEERERSDRLAEVISRRDILETLHAKVSSMLWETERIMPNPRGKK